MALHTKFVWNGSNRHNWGPIAPLIEFIAVSKSYGGPASPIVLDNINFAVDEGDFTAIMGPSGDVVTGAVLASYREIGIPIGFTPRQVVMVFVIQMLIPALAAAVIGIPLGALAAKPLLDMAADAISLPPPSPLAPGIDALVLFIGLGIVAAAAALPAWRAGRLNAVTAITAGAAPSGHWSASLHGRVSWWKLPRPVAVGVADAFARPLRGALTAIAILVGVATLVFATGLYSAILKFNDLFVEPSHQRGSCIEQCPWESPGLSPLLLDQSTPAWNCGDGWSPGCVGWSVPAGTLGSARPGRERAEH